MKKKNLLALFLSLMMATSTMAAFASCKDNDDSSSSDDTTTEETTNDDGLVLNADFETFSNKKGLTPIVTSVTGWTRSVNTATSGTALSSKADSGIIDTQDSAWKDLTESNLTGKKPADLTVDEAKELWDTMSTKDKLEYYKAWKDANPKGDIDEDLSFYEAFNIDTADLLQISDNDGNNTVQIENPRTHDYVQGQEVTEDENGKTNTKVLMLRNDYSASSGNYIGTAQKYTSTSTVTVESGTTAKFSVWVKTSNLRDMRNEEVVDKGAYIQITHTIGGTTLSPLVVKNINTEGVTENNGWVNYSFALTASSFADSTFTIVLGLGMGGGTNRLEYVNGCAFFDDITCETMKSEDFTAETNTIPVNLDADEKVYTQEEATGKQFVLDFTKDLTALDVLSQSGWEYKATSEKRSGKEYTSLAGQNPYPTLGDGFDGTYDINAVGKISDLLNKDDNQFAKAAYNKYFKDHDYLTDGDALVLFSAKGAAYTAVSPDSPQMSIAAGEKKLFSFFVKTSEMDGLTGAGVKLLDGEGNPVLSSIDTTTAYKATVDEEELHDGWVQCFFFVENTMEEGSDPIKLKFEFTFGPTTIVDTAKSAYLPGFAVFTNFQQETMTEKEFEAAVAGSFSKKVTLTGESNQPKGDSGFDTPTVSELTNIENNYALLKNYTGVYSDSVYVGGKNKATNDYANAGLLNKDYADNYSEIYNRLGVNNWNTMFGTDSLAQQPLVIENDTLATEAYGFIGAKKSVSANSYAAISVRVKAVNATANIYLVDTSTNERQVMTVERTLTYWYDDDGNVLSKDPSDDDFVARKHTAFKLQANGLYKVNPTWENAASVDANAYFANLQAYELNATSKNLMLKGSAAYAYNDDWKHDGNDGVAFYNYDEASKSAYAYSDNTTKVFDFSVANVPARYTAKSSQALMATVYNTEDPNDSNSVDGWVDVTFYLHAGDAAKSYRLEVWSGSRDGQTVNTTAGGYVAFDAWSVDSSDTKITEWLTSAKEDMEEGNDYFENVFSFYDSAKYLRYDESLDLNKVGNNYEDYVSSSNTEGTAYLKKGNVTYADFSYEEKTQAVDVEEDDSKTEDDTEETTSPTNVWLLASSIVIAAALLFAVVSLIVRKFVGKSHKMPKVAKPKKEKKTK